MPRFDGTGPAGTGTLTGKKRGKCQSKQSEDSENSFNPPLRLGASRNGNGRKCQNSSGGNGQGKGRKKGFLN